MAAFTGSLKRTDLRIAADHPAYAGHFPGAPVLPGVVLLDAVLRELGRPEGTAPSGWQISAAKFLSAVRPGEPVSLEYESLPNGSVRFVIRASERTVAQGLLTASSSAGPAHGKQG
ncbi:MAG TPA: hypothetical protein VFO44_10750 [Steroidobacteraceae bacterium]|nr:hypothetical protein [Steroidobacteraceae bacterium]